MRSVRALEPTHVRANLTPMIDVVFLLVIFFMLVAQISRTQLVELDPPGIERAASAEITSKKRLVINVIPGSGESDAYRLGVLTFDATESGAAALSVALGRALERTEEAEVYVRADRAESYARVHPALEAVRAAGVGGVRLIVRPEKRRNGIGGGGDAP